MTWRDVCYHPNISNFLASTQASKISRVPVEKQLANYLLIIVIPQRGANARKQRLYELRKNLNITGHNPKASHCEYC
jgi:hypothetical protein